MKQRRQVAIVAGACLIVSLAASALLLHHLDQMRPQARLEDVLYLNSPKILKRLSSATTACSRIFIGLEPCNISASAIIRER